MKTSAGARKKKTTASARKKKVSRASASRAKKTASKRRSPKKKGLAAFPPNLRKMLHPLQRSLGELEKHMEKARLNRERRWEKQQRQLRNDLAKLLRRLERAVAPPKKRSTRK